MRSNDRPYGNRQRAAQFGGHFNGNRIHGRSEAHANENAALQAQSVDSVSKSASIQSTQQQLSLPSTPFFHIGTALLVPTVILSFVFVYWNRRRRRIHKRESYSTLGNSTLLGRNGIKYIDRPRGTSKAAINTTRNMNLSRHHNRSGGILDDEEDDDDPLARYANYHRLPKGSRLNLRRSSMGSPKHPALERVPTFPIRLETMKLLRVVGVRMVAHGVQSNPRRVWISINDDAFVWQSEFKTKLPNNLGASSLLAVRGPVHNIAWGDIKFIDVGKNTDSLKKADSVPETMCWSILTMNGSLDLQSKSQLERDSMVSCMVSMLDEYNDGEDWRAHYYNEKNPTIAAEAGNHSKKGSASHGGADLGCLIFRQ